MALPHGAGGKAICVLQVLAVLATIGVPALVHPQARLYVAPNGNDAWNGLAPSPDGAGNGPKRTLFGARNLIRQMKQQNSLPPSGARVYVYPGRYQHISTFDLTAADSGTSSGTIAYISVVPGGAVLDGSRTISRWQSPSQKPSLDQVDPSIRNFIKTADLRANSVSEAGHMIHSAGNFEMPHTAAELFFNDERMTLAKYPNQGYLRVIGPSPTDTFQAPSFLGDIGPMRTPSFQRLPGNQPDFAHDVYYRGVLNERLYNEFFEKISKMDKMAGSLTVQIDSGNMVDGARRVTANPFQDGRFQLVNSLYELDSPGEYYIDRAALVLYFYPPSTVTATNVRLSMAKEPIVRLRNVRNVTFDGFGVTGGRTDGVEALGCNFVLLRGLKVYGVGGSGVDVREGRFVTVQSCQISGTGETGIHIQGGDRATLVPGNHVAENNWIRNVGQTQSARRPGVFLNGCGMTARNNTIQNVAHTAILFLGNDHLIERNEVDNAVYNYVDIAAISTLWGDWSCRGNVIRENLVQNVSQKLHAYHIVHGLYLDDMYSSALVERNVFRNVEQPIQFGAGFHSKARYNVTFDCVGGFRIDDRGLTAPAEWIQDLRNRANLMPWGSDLWKQRYPELFAVLSSGDQRKPQGNECVGNVFVRSTTTSRIGAVLELWGVNRTDPTATYSAANTVTNANLFVDEARGNLTPKPGSVLWDRGFTPIDMQRMGVQTDRYIDGYAVGWKASLRQ